MPKAMDAKTKARLQAQLKETRKALLAAKKAVGEASRLEETIEQESQEG